MLIFFFNPETTNWKKSSISCFHLKKKKWTQKTPKHPSVFLFVKFACKINWETFSTREKKVTSLTRSRLSAAIGRSQKEVFLKKIHYPKNMEFLTAFEACRSSRRFSGVSNMTASSSAAWKTNTSETTLNYTQVKCAESSLHLGKPAVSQTPQNLFIPSKQKTQTWPFNKPIL